MVRVLGDITTKTDRLSSEMHETVAAVDKHI